MEWYEILLIVVCALQIPLGIMYVYAPKAYEKLPMLLRKQICATLYLITGVIALVSGSDMRMTLFVIAGLFFSWWGDCLLNLTKQILFVIGTAFFLIGHVMYITAFSSVLNATYKQSFFSVIGVSVLAVVMVILFFLFRMDMFDFQGLRWGIMAYAAVITVMLIKSVRLAVCCFAESPAAALCLVAGSIMFMFSDFVLVFITFAGKTGKKMCALNMYPYLAGQMLLALTPTLL